MGAVKNFYHDEICGIAEAAEQGFAECVPLKQAVREYLAREAKPHDVLAILNGSMDDTPAFRKVYGQMWQHYQGDPSWPPKRKLK